MTDKKKFKKGYALVCIGRQGAGKTPSIIELATTSKMRNLVAYDPRGEYDETKFILFRNSQNFKKYISKCENSFIIVEEATGFVASFKDLELTDFLIAVQHRRNVIVFIFHSISDAPKFVLRLSSGVLLFPTNDDKEEVKRSRPGLYKYMNIVGDGKPVWIDNYRKI